MIMFFDTETTGLPKDWKAPMTNLNNWPRVIQLAWSITDLENKELSWGNYLIKPDGWVVPAEKFWLEHGFTQGRLEAEGKPIAEVLETFAGELFSAKVLVSHNMDFDYNVLGAEMLRRDVRTGLKPQRICTKELATDWCKIPFDAKQRRYSSSKQKWKWPTLTELHTKLFGKGFDNAHDAQGDMEALRNCFFELVRLKVINFAL